MYELKLMVRSGSVKCVFPDMEKLKEEEVE